MKRMLAIPSLGLVLAASFVGDVEAAEPIPTRVVGPSSPPSYPDPICTTCLVKTTKSTESSHDTAVIDVEYLEAASFDGDIVVTVLLYTGVRDELVISGVSLESDDVGQFEEHSSAGWTWDEVESVWLEFVEVQ